MTLYGDRLSARETTAVVVLWLLYAIFAFSGVGVSWWLWAF
jgi:hypothetical protein